MSKTSPGTFVSSPPSLLLRSTSSTESGSSCDSECCLVKQRKGEGQAAAVHARYIACMHGDGHGHGHGHGHGWVY